MANHKSAIKRHKQSLKHAARNRAARTRVKNAVKAVRAAITGNDKEQASSALTVAASVLAKVTRDNWMMEAAEKYPGYGFEIHKGYGTKEHRQAIVEKGPCPIHRESFLGKILSGGKK